MFASSSCVSRSALQRAKVKCCACTHTHTPKYDIMRVLQNTHVTHVTPGAPAAGGLGDSCQSGADNPQIPYFGGFDLIFWRIRRIRSASARFKCPVCVRMPDAAGFEGCAPARVAERRSHTCFLFDTGTSLPTGCQLHEQIALAHVGCRQDACGAR